MTRTASPKNLLANAVGCDVLAIHSDAGQISISANNDDVEWMVIGAEPGNGAYIPTLVTEWADGRVSVRILAPGDEVVFQPRINPILLEADAEFETEPPPLPSPAHHQDDPRSGS